MNDANTAVCPAGSAKITSALTCQAAATFLGTNYGGSVTHVARPDSCFLDIGNPYQVYFNDVSGFAFDNAQPLCKVTGAPPQPQPPAHLRGNTVGGVTPQECRSSTQLHVSTPQRVCEYPVSPARVPSTREYPVRAARVPNAACGAEGAAIE